MWVEAAGEELGDPLSSIKHATPGTCSGRRLERGVMPSCSAVGPMVVFAVGCFLFQIMVIGMDDMLLCKIDINEIG